MGGIIRSYEKRLEEVRTEKKQLEQELPTPISMEACEKAYNTTPFDDWLTPFPMTWENFWRSMGLFQAYNIKEVQTIIVDGGLVNESGGNVSLGTSKALTPSEMRSRISYFIYNYGQTLAFAVGCFELILANGDLNGNDYGEYRICI